MALEIRNVSFQVSGKFLLTDVNLTLPDDKITVVMGPNGSGKSLLLRIMHGLLKPSTGKILWDDQTIQKPQSQSQAMVFQRPVLLRRSVIANMLFALKLKGLSNTDVARELLDRVGLKTKATQYAKLLSGGEQQRLALARALALQPKVLFLDEPTANLDPASTGMIEDIVKQVARENCKIIFVSHDIGQAKRLADDIVFMAGGSIKEHQSAQAFFDHPKSQEARNYQDGLLVID